MKVTRKVFSAAVAAFVFAGCISHAGAQEPIRIGAVLSTTGPIGYAGDPALKTLELYVDQVNAAGGVLGRKLQLITYDDASEAAKTSAFTRRLIESDKVDILIGGSGSGGALSVVPLVEKAEVPFIALASTEALVLPVKKWVFKTPATGRMAAGKIFDDMKKRGITKVALLSETSGFGQSGRQAAQAVAGSAGMTLVADETFGPKDSDMTAQLAKIKALPDLQAVLVYGSGPGPAIASRNFVQLGLRVPLYMSDGVATDDFLKLAGSAAEGIRLPSPAMLVVDQLPANDPQKKMLSEFKQGYEARYRTNVSPFAGYAFDAFYIAIEAIKRAGSTEKAKVRDAIEQTKGFAGAGGVYTMSATDHLGLDPLAFRMLEVRQGKWTLVP